MKKTCAEGKCKSKELAYVGKCIKHLSISEKSKLSKQFPEGHYLNEDVGVKTLQDKLASKPMRQFYGDFRISRLQTLQLT